MDCKHGFLPVSADGPDPDEPWADDPERS